jgi:hypothetical protein
MPWLVADGPPMLTATHEWVPYGGGSIVLNDQATNPPTLPFVRILQITGWRSLPESEDNRQPRTFTAGEIVYPSLTNGKTMTYECRVEAATVQTVDSLMTQTMRAFSDMSNEGGMVVTPYSSFGSGDVWNFNARVISFDPDPIWDYDDQRRAHFYWGFALSLRMSDPHFYTGGVGYL